MVKFLLGSYKKGGANKCIFQFFLLMLRISLEILIFRYSAQILLENALFCRQNARPKNRLFCSKLCRQNLSKPTYESVAIAGKERGQKIVQTTLYESVAIAEKCASQKWREDSLVKWFKLRAEGSV